MLKIKSTSLTVVDKKYLLGTKLFTGIAFEPLASKDNFYKAYRYSEGIKVGEYINEYWPQDRSYYYWNSPILNDDEPDVFNMALFYKNQLYFGAVCIFDGNICERELLFKYGKAVSEIWWFPSGQPNSIILDECYEDFYEEYEWHLNNKLLLFHVYHNSFEGKLELSIHGEVTRIVLKKGYFEQLSNYHDKIKFPIIKNKNFAKNLTAGSGLCLDGLDVDDEVFFYLQFCNGLTKVSTMFLNRTSLSIETITNLTNIKKIKRLRVNDERNLLETLIHFQSVRPDCRIWFNNKIL